VNSITTVGNAVDGACRIEGMLHSLALRKNELVKNQSKIEGKVSELMQELQKSIIRDNDLTVINSSSSPSPVNSPQNSMSYSPSYSAHLPEVEIIPRCGNGDSPYEPVTPPQSSPSSVSSTERSVGSYRDVLVETSESEFGSSFGEFTCGSFTSFGELSRPSNNFDAELSKKKCSTISTQHNKSLNNNSNYNNRRGMKTQKPKICKQYSFRSQCHP